MVPSNSSLCTIFLNDQISSSKSKIVLITGTHGSDKKLYRRHVIQSANTSWSSLIKQGLVKLGTFKLLIVVSAGVGLYIGWYQTQGPDYENDPNVHGADRHSLKVELHLKRRRVAYTLIAFFELFLTVLFML